MKNPTPSIRRDARLFIALAIWAAALFAAVGWANPASREADAADEATLGYWI